MLKWDVRSWVVVRGIKSGGFWEFLRLGFEDTLYLNSKGGQVVDMLIWRQRRRWTIESHN